MPADPGGGPTEERDMDEPSVLGAGDPAPMPTRHDAEIAWRRLFAERLVECGVLDAEAARACAEASDVDLECDPLDAADDEVSYWDGD